MKTEFEELKEFNRQHYDELDGQSEYVPTTIFQKTSDDIMGEHGSDDRKRTSRQSSIVLGVMFLIGLSKFIHVNFIQGDIDWPRLIALIAAIVVGSLLLFMIYLSGRSDVRTNKSMNESDGHHS